MTELARPIGDLILETYVPRGRTTVLEVIFQGYPDLPPVLAESRARPAGVSVVTLAHDGRAQDPLTLPVLDDMFALVVSRLPADATAAEPTVLAPLLSKTAPDGYMCLSAVDDRPTGPNPDRAHPLDSLALALASPDCPAARLVEAFSLRDAASCVLYRYVIVERQTRLTGPALSPVSRRVDSADVVINADQLRTAGSPPGRRSGDDHHAADATAALAERIGRLAADRDTLLADLRTALAAKHAAETRARHAEKDFAELAKLYLRASVERDETAVKAEWLRGLAEAVVSLPARAGRPWQSIHRKIRDVVRRRGLFDGAAYLQAYPDVASARLDPLQHFVLHGINEARQPSPPLSVPALDYAARARDLVADGKFSAMAYERAYPDALASGLSAAEHFVRIGEALNRAQSYPNANLIGRTAETAPSAIARPPFQSFGTIAHDPLVSIVIVSFNSGRDLATLFPSIAAQTYQNFEVVLIENGTEDTEPLLRDHFARCRFARADNIGFAAANNLAVDLARGEFLALVNPDTRLDPEMLRHLVDALREDEAAAVAVPKINFFEKFVRLAIQCDGPFSLSAEELLAGLSYRKHFVRSGRIDAGLIHSSAAGLLEIDLPYESARTARCLVRATARPIGSCRVRVGHEAERAIRLDKALDFELMVEFGTGCRAASRYLVNNAGSGLRADGTPFDRGFGEEDHGDFFAKTYVDAMCGCAALIRRVALIDQNLFVEGFFAYFEDSEFSFRIAGRGYRILYNPAAVIFHRHSESTEEHSLTWQVLVSRSQTIYGYATGRTPLPLHTFEFTYPERFTGPLRDKLESMDRGLRNSPDLGALVRPRRQTACVYNTYFSTMGGGEKHALDLAAMLSEDYDVYIASEIDFCLEELSEYFSVDLGRVRKIICTNIDPHFTSLFDVFVNSTFRSNLSSYAARSLYLVSFPHRDADLSIVERYEFLHNSAFTKRWAEAYWGLHRSEVIFPILGQRITPPASHAMAKRAEILSVGRFTPDGHCKNQHLIVEAFRRFVALDPAHQAWRLRLIGSCNLLDARSLSYLAQLETLAAGLNVSIEANAPRDQLEDALASASIYVHATGVGVDPGEPELLEHFGIAPFEAMANGCLPVVYCEGGPAEQIEGLDGALTYRSAAELAPALMAAAQSVAHGTFMPAAAVAHSAAMLEANRTKARTLVRRGNGARIGEDER